MKFKNILMIAAVPILLLVYAIYLLKQKTSGGFTDIIGAVFALIAVFGFLLALILSFFMRGYKWSDKWYMNVVLGIAGVICLFVIIMIYARIA